MNTPEIEHKTKRLAEVMSEPFEVAFRADSRAKVRKTRMLRVFQNEVYLTVETAERRIRQMPDEEVTTSMRAIYHRYVLTVSCDEDFIPDDTVPLPATDSLRKSAETIIESFDFEDGKNGNWEIDESRVVPECRWPDKKTDHRGRTLHSLD